MSKVIYLNKTSSLEQTQSDESFKRLLKIIVFFSTYSTSFLFKSKLNIYLFYFQVLYLKEQQESYIPYPFIKDYNGPVMKDLDELLNQMVHYKLIKIAKTNYGEIIRSCIALNSKNYTDKEFDLLNKILNKFDGYSSFQLVNYVKEEYILKNTFIKKVINMNSTSLIYDF